MFLLGKRTVVIVISANLNSGGGGGGEYVTIRGVFSVRVVNVSGGVRTQKNTMMNHNLLSQTL